MSFAKANAIIAYNNRPATEAVPYFEQVIDLYALLHIVHLRLGYIVVNVYDLIVQLGPLVNQMVPIIEASPVSSVARTASGSVLTCFHCIYFL